MNTKIETTQTAQVFTDSDGEQHFFGYNNIELFIEELHSYIEDNYPTDDDIKITLETGESFYWNTYAAHACFAKGRITVKDLVALLLKEEEVKP